MHLVTRQQRLYEAAYVSPRDDYGFPDPKIADGKVLTGKNILTLGCGMANDLWHLAAANHIVGVDYAGTGLAIAREHGIDVHEFDLNRGTRFAFEDASFDVVICKDILEHLLEPLLVLHEVRRVLKPDGYVIISVPNHFALPMRLRMLFGRGLIYRSLLGGHDDYEEWNYMHIRFFTFRGFKRFLQEAGFRPEKWFWDFGNLAHYRNPDMWLAPQLWKKNHAMPVSRRGQFGIFVLRPLWRLFNIVFPRSLRRAIVCLSPNLLCAGFYVRCVKSTDTDGQ